MTTAKAPAVPVETMYAGKGANVMIKVYRGGAITLQLADAEPFLLAPSTCDELGIDLRRAARVAHEAQDG